MWTLAHPKQNTAPIMLIQSITVLFSALLAFSQLILTSGIYMCDRSAGPHKLMVWSKYCCFTSFFPQKQQVIVHKLDYKSKYVLFFKQNLDWHCSRRILQHLSEAEVCRNIKELLKLSLWKWKLARLLKSSHTVMWKGSFQVPPMIQQLVGALLTALSA